MALKLIAAALAASVMIAAPALAQSNLPAKSDKQSATKSDKQSATAPAAGTATNEMQHQWRLSKFTGLDVYNAQNEKIGDISDLIADESGKVDRVVIGVGGFLGIGQHNVGLPWDKVKFVMEPIKTNTERTSVNSRTTTGSGVITRPVVGPRATPDHAVVNMTKDQLKALPEFKIASGMSSKSGTSSGPAGSIPPEKPQMPLNR
jgi:sporulation protein YlmC with PRC-barrel domain